MKENERKWKKKRKFKKMKENEKNMKEFIIPLGIRRAARAAPLFSLGEKKTSSECALFHREKGEPPGRDLRGTSIWRREMSINTTEMHTNLAILERRYDLTHPTPTIYDSQPDHHQNVHYSTGKVTTSQYKANKASSECPLFPKESWSAATNFWAPKKRKKRNKMKKEETLFLRKQKGHKGIKNEKGKT